MKLFLLKNREGGLGYDCAYGFVVRAFKPSSARIVASNKSGDEGMEIWLDAKKTSCHQLTEDGPTGVILRDFHAG